MGGFSGKLSGHSSHFQQIGFKCRLLSRYVYTCFDKHQKVCGSVEESRFWQVLMY